MKKTLLILLTLLVGQSMNAYDGVAKLFTEEKGEIFNSLSLVARYDLLNNYGKDTKAEQLNGLQTSESHILKLTHDYMLIATSQGGRVEMKLLPKSKKDTVLAVIETVVTPYKDSRISFYDMNWNQLSTDKFITVPTIDDFINEKAPRQLVEELKSLVYFAMIELTFEDETLIAKCYLEDFFMGENFARYAPIVTNRVVYSIKKAKFKKEKPKH